MGPKTIVEIINKSHPLCGQKGVLIKVGSGKDPKVKIRLIDGSELEVTRSWTNFQAIPVSNSSGETEHLLDASGLLEMTKSIKEIKRQSNIVGDRPSGSRAKKVKAGSKRRVE